MADEKKETAMENLQVQYTRLEKYVLENMQTVLYITSGIIVIILAVLLVFKWYLPKKNVDAMGEMYTAQKYFAIDSLNLALNGDKTHAGFLKVAKNYGYTPAGKLAHYYAGNILLKQGKFEDAITHLKKFDTEDKIVSTLCLGLLGDAYSELGKVDEAVDYYKKAAYTNENETTSPMFLNKAAMFYYHNKKSKEAKGLFEELKNKYPDTQEGHMADRYIEAIDVAGN